MADHVHFDLIEAERQMRAGIRQTNIEAMSRARGDWDRELVKLQGNLEDMVVAAGIFGMRCLNEMATERVATDALGYMIGNIMWSFAQNCEGDTVDVFDRIMRCVWISAEQCNSGDQDGVVEGQTLISATKSGRA